MNKVWFCLLSLTALSVSSFAHAETADERHAKPGWLALDANKDGKVQLSELTPEQLKAQKAKDLNGDGLISLAEYTAAEIDPRGDARIPLPDNVKWIPNLSYAANSDPRQQVDIYMPKSPSVAGPLPVVAYLHGGGWSGGSRLMARGMVLPLVNSGKYIAVSIGYRLSWQATWPAQINDVKAGIRWIRANAQQYGMDPNRICATGPSAGGHLAAELGLTNGEASVEGRVGKNLKQSSKVQCAIDLFGPTDLRDGPDDGSAAALLGKNPRNREELARNASPITFVDPSDPPFMIIHGTRDMTVNLQNSVNLDSALRNAGVPVIFQMIDGGGHGDFGAALPEMMARIALFLDRNFYDPKTVVPSDALKK